MIECKITKTGVYIGSPLAHYFVKKRVIIIALPGFSVPINLKSTTMYDLITVGI
jgi:hypothetical protein